MESCWITDSMIFELGVEGGVWLRSGIRVLRSELGLRGWLELPWRHGRNGFAKNYTYGKRHSERLR